MIGSLLSAYWLIIIFALLAFIVLYFAFDRRKPRDSNRYSLSYIEGLKAMVENDDQTAFIRFKQTVAEDSENIDAYLRLGDLLRKRGQIQKAVQVHRQLLLRKTIDKEAIAQIWKGLAADFIAARRFNLAQEILEKLSNEAAHKRWAREKLLEIFEKTGRFDSAFEVAKEIYRSKDQQPKLAAYRQLEGNQYFEKKDYHKARLAYKDALHYDDKFAPAYMMIAESYLAENKKEDAAEYYVKLAENAPSEAWRVFQKLEQTLFELGRFSDAEQIYLKLMRECPKDSRVFYSFATIAEKKNNLPAAIDSLGQALSINPADAIAAARLAQLYIESGQKQKAIKTLQDVRNHLSTDRDEYSCPYCAKKSSNRELLCPGCGRVGPYQENMAG